jgi:hypothetical protein
MLRGSPPKKNKINLEDYDFKQDIENRLLMSHFTIFDVKVLEEVLHSSLTLQVSNLAATLDTDVNDVTEVIDKLSQTGLLKRTGEMIKVDKEMRKYYEFQSLKFDDDFEPNMPFVQTLLKKLPIHVLPNWYAIPRTSTDIFQSIIDRYLLTPRIFQRYLLELNFDDPVVQKIIDDVFAAPDFKIRAKELRERHGLSREKFEECLLLLEFSFVCCLSYQKIDGDWKEVVTPFHEWRQYLRFLRDTTPQPLTSPVTETTPGELAFATAVRTRMEAIKKGPVTVDEPDHVINKLVHLGIADLEGNRVSLDEAAHEWIELSLKDQAIALYRHPENRIITEPVDSALDTERNLREVEKALSRVANTDWIDYQQFLKGMMVPIGETAGPTLSKEGRRWSYAIPQYSESERQFIHAALFERLYEAGFVSLGTHAGGDAFRITSFGRSMLSLA